ncbi:hypothetical protein DFP73DRAFT_537186 [Morchella snyderi]|nr:hypothetical protein DFP73DRAFT_537186 [Morchella snyderi]
MQKKEQNKPKRVKKPYDIKKADLDLAGYRKELDDRSPAHLFQRAITSLRASRQFHLYLLLQAIAAFFGYGQFVFCIGILWMCYVNTGTRKDGEKSAYSVFNKDVEAIDGATNLEYLDREIRRQIY